MSHHSHHLRYFTITISAANWILKATYFYHYFPIRTLLHTTHALLCSNTSKSHSLTPRPWVTHRSIDIPSSDQGTSVHIRLTTDIITLLISGENTNNYIIALVYIFCHLSFWFLPIFYFNLSGTFLSVLCGPVLERMTMET